MTVAAADLPPPEDVERQRRSVAMLAPGQPVFAREEALDLLGLLVEALLEVKRLRSGDSS